VRKVGKDIKTIGTILTLFCVLGSFVVLFNTKTDASQIPLQVEKYSHRVMPENLEEHPPIRIRYNSNFEMYNFSGEGTELDPYQIKNLNITAIGGNFIKCGIEIFGISAYFEIRDCLITSEYLGIWITDVASGRVKIVNNTCIGTTGFGTGVSISSTSNCVIEDNECSNFMNGMILTCSHSNTITRNLILNNKHTGINSVYSSYNLVTFNHIENSKEFGIALVGGYHVRNNSIHHNYFVNNSITTNYIIGTRTGVSTSQGYDEGLYNIWYDEANKYGNHWSDYDGNGDYIIDGPVHSKDIYPLTLTATKIFPVSFILLILSIIFLELFFRKAKKRN
jgi:parallel beta-helix repeat protein